MQEFYSLHAALVQYHGGFEDIKLPSRGKLFGGQRGLDVLQSKQEPFQEFLVKLLQVGLISPLPQHVKTVCVAAARPPEV